MRMGFVDKLRRYDGVSKDLFGVAVCRRGCVFHSERAFANAPVATVSSFLHELLCKSIGRNVRYQASDFFFAQDSWLDLNSCCIPIFLKTDLLFGQSLLWSCEVISTIAFALTKSFLAFHSGHLVNASNNYQRNASQPTGGSLFSVWHLVR